ncbi:MAG: hypothetical protein IPL39_24160 [Opitutaceae bacterium]|nr:hypothetical protein [Opitutaceae bacterium]
MKTRLIRSLAAPAETSLFDALLLMVAGAALEAQTHGEVKPFGKQRLTLKTLNARHAGAQ